jgi:hypothetical protein
LHKEVASKTTLPKCRAGIREKEGTSNLKIRVWKVLLDYPKVIELFPPGGARTLTDVLTSSFFSSSSSSSGFARTPAAGNS